jgi:two-component system sensor histidine kinase PilS (NtrC family)
MEKTINDFLQLSQPSSAVPEWFDLQRMAAEILRKIHAKKSRYPGCTIITEIPEHLDCWGDRRMLQTALVHLLENSCYASADCSEPIILRAEEDRREDQSVIQISVIDRGIGIAKEIREQIFAPFFSTREDGTGLGLAVVRQFIEQHGGSVAFLEPEDGVGSIVRIQLPLPISSEDE